MNCKKCGNMLETTDLFCKKCGEPVNNGMAENNMPNQPTGVVNNEFLNNQPVNNNMNQMQMNPQFSNNQNINYGANGEATPNLNANIPPVNFNNQMGQNYMGNQQPTMNYNQPVNPSKKKMSPFIIVVIILAIIIVILGVVLVSKNFFSNSNNENTVIDNETNNTNNNNTETDSVNNGNTNTFEYNYFNFPLPDTYTATINTGNIMQMVSQNDQVISLSATISGFTVEDVESELEELKKSFSDDGYTVKSSKTATYDGVKFVMIYLSMMSDGQELNLVETYATLGSYHVIETAIMNVGSLSDEEVLTKYAKMYKNTTTSNGQFSGNTEKGELKNNLINQLDPSLVK